MAKHDCHVAHAERAGSLLGTVDRCVTSAGARLLAEDLSAPLARQQNIEARLALLNERDEA